MIRALTLSVLALPLAAPAFAGAAADTVEVVSARARAMPPGAPASGAFATLRNTDTVDHTLVSAASPAATTVELHTHVAEDGMMKMRQIPEIALPAGQDTVLNPGGLHIMLIGLTGPLAVGDTLELTLTFADGTTKVAAVPVREIGRKHKGPHGKHAKAGKGHGHGKKAGTCDGTCKGQGGCDGTCAMGTSSTDEADGTPAEGEAGTCACGKAAGTCGCGGH